VHKQATPWRRIRVSLQIRPRIFRTLISDAAEAKLGGNWLGQFTAKQRLALANNASTRQEMEKATVVAGKLPGRGIVHCVCSVVQIRSPYANKIAASTWVCIPVGTEISNVTNGDLARCNRSCKSAFRDAHAAIVHIARYHS
jgi:hypothetical protein